VFAALRTGALVLLDDGKVRLRVTDHGPDFAETEVEAGDHLSDHKGLNLPGLAIPIPALTEKDRKDLAFALKEGVDWVALSFVQRASDMAELRGLVQGRASVLAKIEKPSALEALDEILDLSQAIMVARGDLGVQLPLEKIPLIQLDILARTNAAGRIAITATEMLESMTKATRPTRAEVTDVASAVLAGTDAVMLSAETATGNHPVRTVEVMDIICREIEGSLGPPTFGHGLLKDGDERFPSATAKAAVEAASSLGIETIVAFTESGNSARLLSKYRPLARIIAFTPEPRTLARMALYWGVRPLPFQRLDSTDEMIAYAEKKVLELGICRPGDGVVLVAGVPPNERHSTNLMKLHVVRG
jgi:pyruvate kinase